MHRCERMTIFIALFLLGISEITFTVAQKGTVPKIICQVATFDISHTFGVDPNIDTSELIDNTETIGLLRGFITSPKRCSVVVANTQLFQTSYSKTPAPPATFPVYREMIKIQVSANANVSDAAGTVNNLTFCLEDVIKAVTGNRTFTGSRKLNVSGNLIRAVLSSVTGGHETCCHVIYGKSPTTNRCCKEGFVEIENDWCACPKGKFLNRDSCDSCPEDTYQPEARSTGCLACPSNTTTYGETGADDLNAFCLQACLPGQRYNSTSQTCTTCPKNTYQPLEGQQTCIRCQDNKITKEDGSTKKEECVQSCPKGSFYNFTSNGCELCPQNSFQTEEGQFTCSPCKEARITISNGTMVEEDCIKNCSQGSFFNETKKECQPCPLNTYQPNSGAIECIQCPDGKITVNTSSKMRKECINMCQPGEYYNNRTTKCEPCSRNTYQPIQRQFSCINCPDGTSTKSDKSTSLNDCLRDCDKGLFHDSTSNSCKECPIGKYKDRNGHHECTDCPEEHTTLSKGSVSDTQCIRECFEGKYYNLTLKRCLSCPLDTYQDLKVATTCVPCPDGGFTERNGTASLNDCMMGSAQPEERSDDDLMLIVTIPVALTILVLSACLLFLCFYRKWQIKEKQRQRMSGRPLDPRGRRRSKEFDVEMGERLDSEASMANHHYKMKGTGLKTDDVRPSIRIANIPKELEIPRDSLKFLGQVLGKGNFGKVEKAILLKDDRTEHVVAVKMIKGGGTFSDEKELFDELEMLASLYPHPHPNIVNLVGGCTTSDGPLFVVVEYCGEGNLLKYLQKNQVQMRPRQEYVNIPPKAQKPGIRYEWKLQKALEICNGMAHLAKFKIIHRDVAARNVLLDQHWVAKISDFGMARDIYVKQIYRKDTEGFLPVRWMAIESLESFIYTTQSDVWSFGILLWEIISDGRVPYNNILDHTQLLNYIKSGRVMKRPKVCPKDLYHMMEKCWSTDPSDRPSFDSLKDALEFLYENEVHKDDALPQRILRKFSSRRKKRQAESESAENPRRSLRVKKTFSNASTLKISKIEEEETKSKNDIVPEGKGIRLENLEPAKEETTVTNEFENEGYEKSCSSASEEQEALEKSQKAHNEDNFELDTISETPLSDEKEEMQNNTDEPRERRTLPEEEEGSLSLQELIENELKGPIESGENDSTPPQENNTTGVDRKGLRKSSTFC